MKKSISLAFVFLAALLFSQEWNFQNGRYDWTGEYHLQAYCTEDGLEIQTVDMHSNLSADQVYFSAADLNYLVITYTATGLASNPGGYLFFGTAEDTTLDEEKKFYLPGLTWDGQEHQLLVDLKEKGRNRSFEIWQNASAITRLRLDLVPDAGAKVLLKSIAFKQLDREEVRAELFRDEIAAGIPLTLPVDMPNAEVSPQKSEASAIFVSGMISPDETFAHLGICCLRKTFALDAPVKEALWQSVCDDQIQGAWLNGQQILRDWSESWQIPDAFAIPPEYFQEGENVLAVAYANNSSLGGLMLDLQLLLENDKLQIVTLENARGLANDPPYGWEQPEFDCSDWKTASQRPGPPAQPWVNFSPSYRTVQGGQTGGSVAILQKENDGLVVDVRFSAPGGFQKEDKFFAILCGSSGQTLVSYTGTMESLGGKALPDGVEFHFAGAPAVCYGVPCTFRWEFGMAGRRLTGETNLTVTTKERAVPGKPLVATMKQTPEGPIPLRNGKPWYFNVLTVHNYTTSKIHTGMEGAASPFNVVAIRLGGMSNLWWVGPDQYDFREIDRSLSILLEQYPDSMLGLYVWCQPGAWYSKAYPERLSHMEDGSTYNYYVSAIDFANPEYRADAVRAIDALVRHLEKYFGSKTFLYNLMGGISCEWQGWAAHSDQFADFSEGGTREFQEYAAQKGVTVSGVPTRQQRKASMDGVFRNPVENAEAILYDQYYSESIAECIAQLAAATKRACGGNKLVGCYYGYLMEYANMGQCTNGGGHNELSRLLESPDVDFFLSPQSYAIRNLGAPDADMKPYGAIWNAGKFSMLEDDTRTHMTFKTDFEQTVNLDATLNILKRNVGMALCHRTPLNHLPLVGGNELDHPAIRAMFLRAMQAGQYLVEKGASPTPQVAAVIDEDAIRYCANNRTVVQIPDRSRYSYAHNGDIRRLDRYVQPIVGELYGFQRIPLAQFGAPVDVVLLEDILRDPTKYPMVIFLNAVKDKPELRQAIQGLRQAGATLVFVYGTGFLGDEEISVESLSECVGMELDLAGEGTLLLQEEDNGATMGQPYAVKTRFRVLDADAIPIASYMGSYDLAVAQKGKNFFYGTPDLSREFLRRAAREAGVHLYCESDDNLYASHDVVSFHANSRGHKTIRLPRKCDVVDLFSGEIMGTDVEAIEFDAEAFESRVFLLGKLDDLQKITQ